MKWAEIVDGGEMEVRLAIESLRFEQSKKRSGGLKL